MQEKKGQAFAGDNSIVFSKYDNLSEEALSQVEQITKIELSMSAMYHLEDNIHLISQLATSKFTNLGNLEIVFIDKRIDCKIITSTSELNENKSPLYQLTQLNKQLNAGWMSIFSNTDEYSQAFIGDFPVRMDLSVISYSKSDEIFKQLETIDRLNMGKLSMLKNKSLDFPKVTAIDLSRTTVELEDLFLISSQSFPNLEQIYLCDTPAARQWKKKMNKKAKARYIDRLRIWSPNVSILEFCD